MATVNISLPVQLRTQAQQLINNGYYSSFSDLTRDALRKLISETKYDFMASQAVKEHQKGKATELRTPKDIENFVESLA